MPIKTALLAALSILMLQLPGAGLANAGGRDHRAAAVTDPETTGALPAKAAVTAIPDATVLHPGLGPAGDIVGAYGPNPHARELTQIAIYASVGNTDGVAMLTSELRSQGVTKETMRRAINRINVHGDVFVVSPPRHARNTSQADPGFQVSQ